jgi:proteasome lid subunit RPN8/RPN11
MLQGLVSSANLLLDDLRRSLFPPSPVNPPAGHAVPCSRLRRVLLTDGVGRTLFEQYASHRASPEGEEETGWLLLGLREADRAVALAALPAGGQRDAGVTHVRFNTTAQAVASRIIRQADRRLRPIGVVHTHPGSLRHPSDADLRGDREWVGGLHGHEGVFAIGTADVPAGAAIMYAAHPRANVHCLGELRFSWYALRHGEAGYRPLPVELTLGPDLARDLHTVWATLEEHAERVARLGEQQANLRIDVVSVDGVPTLQLVLPLAEAGVLRLLLRGRDVGYYLERQGALIAVEHHDPLVDRGVYALLARLAVEA